MTMDGTKTPEAILRKHYDLMYEQYPDKYKKWQDPQVYARPEIRTAIAAIKDYHSQFTSANEGSVVVTDEMIEKEATDYCDCLVYEDTERYADYDYFKSCYVSACAWVRDQYEKK